MPKASLMNLLLRIEGQKDVVYIVTNFIIPKKKIILKRGYTIQVLRGQSAVEIALNEKKFKTLKFGNKFHEEFFG